MPTRQTPFSDHTTPNSDRVPLSADELLRLRKERVTAQHKFVKDAADTQAACEVEEKELKRKTAIKEKEQATSETVEN